MYHKTINVIHTPCKNCAFAKYVDNVQVSCELGYLEIYKNMSNVDVIDAYDETKDFFVINNKKCIGYRENKWFDQFGGSDLSISDKVNLYYKYNKINYLLSINLQYFKTREQFEHLIQNINTLSIPPQKLILVRYPASSSEKLFAYEYLKDILDTINIEWKIQTVVDSSISYEHILHTIISTNKKYRFIASINTYNTDIKQVIPYANDLICKELQAFNIISNKDKSTIIFPSIVYRYSMFMYKENILYDENKYIYI